MAGRVDRAGRISTTSCERASAASFFTVLPERSCSVGVSGALAEASSPPGSTSGEILSTWMPTGEHRFAWKEGPAIRAWRGKDGRGTRLVLDEVDRASGDALATLLAITDSPESARWRNPDTLEWVRPGREFSVVMTSNVDDAGDSRRLRDPVSTSIAVTVPAAHGRPVVATCARPPSPGHSVPENAVSHYAAFTPSMSCTCPPRRGTGGNLRLWLRRGPSMLGAARRLAHSS